MVPRRFRHLAAGQSNKAATAASLAFLDEIWRYPKAAYTFLGIKSRGKWIEKPINGARIDQVAKVLETFQATECDIYFCPNPFDRNMRKTEFALSTHYAWCDIDKADPDGYEPKPNILWETSPGRHQGLWIWLREAEGLVAEQYSKNIVYKNGGDKGGWSVTKMLRLPGTLNHKAAYKKPVVTLKHYDTKPERLPKSLSRLQLAVSQVWNEAAFINIAEFDPEEVSRRHRRSMSIFARTLMTATRVIYPDRSEAIFAIVSELALAGASNSEIASVLMINPHFVEKHGDDLAMAQREIVSIRSKVETKP